MKGRYAEGTREAGECRKCGQPIWFVYHGPHANHTIEPRESGEYQRAVSERAVEAAMAKLRASGNVSSDPRAWNTRLTAEAMLAAAAHADEEEVE